MIPSGFRGAARRITDDRPYIEAAAELGCEVAAVEAVAEVESRGDAFLSDGRPKILFERHVFSRRTARRHDAAHPDVSNPTPGGYRGGAAEYERLDKALSLGGSTALESASWGRFQIMGFNYSVCGFQSVEAFVEAMCEGEEGQFDAFVAFVQRNRLDGALRACDWAAFARGYNGPGYAINDYDGKMARAYARRVAERASGRAPGFRVVDVHSLQIALNHLGADAGHADGLMGPKTAAAIRRFQDQSRLPETGEPTPDLMAAVQAVYFALGGQPGA